jgi:hypothetical protein
MMTFARWRFCWWLWWLRSAREWGLCGTRWYRWLARRAAGASC